MANVLHRTTKQYRLSASPIDHPVIDWIHDPDVSAGAGFDSKYWIITGDIVTLMDQAARDAVDAQELSDGYDATANQLDGVDAVLRAFALVMLDELNNHADRINEILDAADNATSLASFKAAMVNITNYPQRDIGQLKTSVRGKLGT